MIYLQRPSGEGAGTMKKLIQDPLTHFLLVGAVIFAVSYWLNPPGTEAATEIVIAPDDVAKMRETIALVQGRPATDGEVNDVIEARIREEVLYREALAMGLDSDDTIVRNRLIEKMRFLTENVGEPPLPTDAELEAWFAGQQDRFRIPPRVTFEHVFFATERRGERAESDAIASLRGLRSRRDTLTPAMLAELGDPLPLWNRYDDMPVGDVGLAFGDEFATALAPIDAGSWEGPMRSRFGWHLVRVVDRSPERQPALAEIRDAVQTAYLNERRQADNEVRYRAMLERYDVRVEAAGAASDASTDGAAPVRNPS